MSFVPSSDVPLIIMDKLHLGASKSDEFVLQNTTIAAVCANIQTIARNDSWKQQLNETSVTHSNQGWMSGGFGVSGYQQIGINLDQVENDVKVKIGSRSIGGQLNDWGANEYNVNRLGEFLKNPNLQLGKRFIPGEGRGTILLAITFILGVIIVGGILFLFSYYNGTH